LALMHLMSLWYKMRMTQVGLSIISAPDPAWWQWWTWLTTHSTEHEFPKLLRSHSSPVWLGETGWAPRLPWTRVHTSSEVRVPLHYAQPCLQAWFIHSGINKCHSTWG
jgi:hypothetical protein